MKWLHKNRSIRKDKLFLHIKSGVECIEILAVKLILNDTQRFAETLVVNNLTHAEELDNVADIRVFYQAQDVVVGGAGLLLCCNLTSTT